MEYLYSEDHYSHWKSDTLLSDKNISSPYYLAAWQFLFISIIVLAGPAADLMELLCIMIIKWQCRWSCVFTVINHAFEVFYLALSTENSNRMQGFTKLHMGLVILVKKMSVLINFLLQNTNLVSVLSKICLNFAGNVWQDWHISWTLFVVFFMKKLSEY